jgi:hypothetical protein
MGKLDAQRRSGTAHAATRMVDATLESTSLETNRSCRKISLPLLRQHLSHSPAQEFQ